MVWFRDVAKLVGDYVVYCVHRRLPASPQDIAVYIAAQASELKTSTVTRRLAALGKAHRVAGFSDPTKSEIVRSAMRGLRRLKGAAPDEAKPLLRDDLIVILDRLGHRRKDIRDRALLLLGFAGAFRRSELVALDRSDCTSVREGLIVTIRRSKTDQEGRGRRIGIPHGRGRWCPVKAVEAWLEASGELDGPLFRVMNRHGQSGAQRLSGEAVSLILRERMRQAGLNSSGYSGHSLRAGFATSAAMAGAASYKIRAQTGHASDAMLSRYIRDSDLFTGNAAGMVL